MPFLSALLAGACEFVAVEVEKVVARLVIFFEIPGTGPWLTFKLRLLANTGY